MKIRARKVEEAVAVFETRDPLEMSVREFLSVLMQSHCVSDEWVNIRDERYPWKHIVAAAEQGECEVSRIGRRLMMRRDQLTKFLDARRIGLKKLVKAPKTDAPEGEFDGSVQRALRRNGLA